MAMDEWWHDVVEAALIYKQVQGGYLEPVGKKERYEACVGRYTKDQPLSVSCRSRQSLLTFSVVRFDLLPHGFTDLEFAVENSHALTVLSAKQGSSKREGGSRRSVNVFASVPLVTIALFVTFAGSYIGFPTCLVGSCSTTKWRDMRSL